MGEQSDHIKSTLVTELYQHHPTVARVKQLHEVILPGLDNELEKQVHSCVCPANL